MNNYESKILSTALLGHIDKRETALEEFERSRDREAIIANVEPRLLYEDYNNGSENVTKKYSRYLRDVTTVQIKMVVKLLENSCIDLQRKWNLITETSFETYGKSVWAGMKSVKDETYGKGWVEAGVNIASQIIKIKTGQYSVEDIEKDIEKIGKGILFSYEKGEDVVKEYNNHVDLFFNDRHEVKKHLADASARLCTIIEEDYDFYKQYGWLDNLRKSKYDDPRAYSNYSAANIEIEEDSATILLRGLIKEIKTGQLPIMKKRFTLRKLFNFNSIASAPVLRKQLDKSLLEIFFDSLCVYTPTTLDNHLEKILWTSDVKAYLMENRADLIEQTKVALSSIGIIGNDAVMFLDMRFEYKLGDIIGWDYYSFLAEQYSYRRSEDRW